MSGRSMYSFIPNEKFPVLSKFDMRSVFSFASRSLFRKGSVPFLIVILQPIALFFGTLNVFRFLVLVTTTVAPETFFSTVFAISIGVFVPHPTFNVIFSILMSLIPISIPFLGHVFEYYLRFFVFFTFL